MEALMINDNTRQSILQNRKINGKNWDTSDEQLKANQKQYEARKKIESLLENRRLKSELDEYENFDLND